MDEDTGAQVCDFGGLSAARLPSLRSPGPRVVGALRLLPCDVGGGDPVALCGGPGSQADAGLTLCVFSYRTTVLNGLLSEE